MSKNNKIIEDDWQYSEYGISSEKYGRILFSIEPGHNCSIAEVYDINIRNINNMKECVRAFKHSLHLLRQTIYIALLHSLREVELSFLKDVGFTEVKKANHNDMIFLLYKNSK